MISKTFLPLKQNNILYTRLTKEYYDKTIQLVTETFVHSEPLTMSIKIPKQEFEGFMREFLYGFIGSEYSIIAIDLRNDSVVGFVFNEDVYHSFGQELPVRNEKMDAIFAILDQLQNDFFSHHQMKPNSFFHVFMVGADPNSDCKILAGIMCKMSVQLALMNDFDFVIGESTAYLPQRTLMRMGWQTGAEVVYKDFVFKGNKVFAEIENPPTVKLLYIDNSKLKKIGFKERD